MKSLGKTLNDYCELIVDCEHKTAPKENHDTGFYSVRTPNIGRGRLILGNVNCVSEDTYIEWSRRAVPRAKDLILAREAPVGNVAIIPERIKVCLGQRTVLIRPDQQKVDPDYLVYYLNGNEVQGKFHGLTAGATVAHLNMRDIRGLEIPYLPSLETQRKISAVLSAYDDLIENNTRRIAILEEMAQALYREWFVHFRFPGHEDVKMVEVEGYGRVPEGWQVKNLLDIADVQYGFAFKSKQFTENENGGKPVIRIRDVKTNSSKTYTDEVANDKYIVENGDILIGMDGDFHMCRWAGGTAYLVQRVARFRSSHGLPRYYLFLALEKPIKYFNQTITGTTVAHLGHKHIKTIKIAIPDENTLEMVKDYLDPLFDLELNLRLKNDQLRQTRDLLLPRLISGELDVSELDIQLPEELEDSAAS